jgi:hypothetical protein
MESEGSLPYSQESSICLYPEPDQFIPYYPISLRYILIFSTHLLLGFSSSFSPSVFPTNNLYPPLFHSCYMPCSSHPPWLNHSQLFDCKEYNLQSSLLCRFLQPPITSPLFDPDIILRILFSNTLSLCSSLNVREHVSHPYRTTGKIVVLSILIFTFLDSRREDKMFRTEW